MISVACERRALGCCNDFQGGQLKVPGGSTITIRQGVSEQTLGILKNYLNAQTTTITVSGTTVDVRDAWPAPVGFVRKVGHLHQVPDRGHAQAE